MLCEQWSQAQNFEQNFQPAAAELYRHFPPHNGVAVFAKIVADNFLDSSILQAAKHDGRRSNLCGRDCRR